MGREWRRSWGWSPAPAARQGHYSLSFSSRSSRFGAAGSFCFIFIFFSRFRSRSELPAPRLLLHNASHSAAPGPASPGPASSCPRPGGGALGAAGPRRAGSDPGRVLREPCRPVFLLLLLLNFFIVPPSCPPHPLLPPPALPFSTLGGFSGPGSPQVWPASWKIMGGRMESCVKGFGGKTSTYRTKVLPVLEREACV